MSGETVLHTCYWTEDHKCEHGYEAIGVLTLYPHASGREDYGTASVLAKSDTTGPAQLTEEEAG